MVNSQRQLSNIFSALADPTRRRILERLSRLGQCRVTALAKPFRMSLPAISRHLRVLEEAKLVHRQKKGREHLITAEPETLKGAQQWIAQYVTYWESRFDAMDEILKRQTRKGSKS
ncbi:MAG: metalloregulator ArsR/SmtB family transcription factor [Pirellulales bacterium]|nr:metalloregulator ArsR/SmtB family transcription factor [Pirellulales bacterium]